jgi:hypothetical protein
MDANLSQLEKESRLKDRKLEQMTLNHETLEEVKAKHSQELQAYQREALKYREEIEKLTGLLLYN